MADVQHKRGTRSDLNTLAAANGLLVGQVYFITDEDRLSIATSVSAYQAAAKEGEGGSLELYAENPSSPTAPSATGTNAVAVGEQGVSAGTRSVSAGKSRAGGDDSFAAAIGNNTSSYGVKDTAHRAVSIGSFSDARAVEAVAIGREASAQGSKSASLGYRAFSIGIQSVAAGHSYAGGADSFAAVITNNTSTYGATGANSIAMGASAKATGSRDISAGRFSQATGGSSVAIGSSATASGADSLALGRSVDATGSQSGAVGYSADATALRSFALGHSSISNIVGKYAYAGGFIAATGDTQTGTFVLRKGTTDATPAALSTGSVNATAGADDQIILPNNSAFAFHGTIVARQQASTGTACAAWRVEGLIRREGSAGATVLVNSATTILDNTPAWGMTLSADTTNGGLKIEITGAAATNIRFVATINTSEVTY